MEGGKNGFKTRFCVEGKEMPASERSRGDSLGAKKMKILAKRGGGGAEGDKGLVQGWSPVGLLWGPVIRAMNL